MNKLLLVGMILSMDYLQTVAEIIPAYLTDPASLRVSPEPRKSGKFVSYSYCWPMRAIITTQGQIPLRTD